MDNKIRDFKVLSLPLKGIPNARYYVPNTDGITIDQYITDKKGNFKKVGNSNNSVPSDYDEITESLIGNVNGSNSTFITSYSFDPDSTIVFVNGLKQKKPIHYNNINTNTILFTESPQPGDILEINYIKI